MKRAVVAAFALMVLPSPASATWSVIAVDRATGRVVIASVTCVDRDDQFLMGVQAVVVPAKGVAACQAGVDGTHKNQMLVQSPPQTRAAVEQAMAGKIRAKGSLVDCSGASGACSAS